jgi:hypothetical protein
MVKHFILKDKNLDIEQTRPKTSDSDYERSEVRSTKVRHDFNVVNR